MSFADKGNEELEGLESLNIENSNIDGNITNLRGCDIQNLSDLSQELTLSTTDMETDEIVVESQEVVEHEEEVEMEEVVTEEIKVIVDHSNSSEQQTLEIKTTKPTVVPPLRPLTIAPKPAKVPLTVKSVGGQPLILLQGGTGGQAIKLVTASHGQELNLANIMSRPITLKPTYKTISSSMGNISLVQQKPMLMKKVITSSSQKSGAKSVTTIPKHSQHFMVVQKADQQQLKLIQTQGLVQGVQTPTKTLTLQQAQEMGLLTNAKLAAPPVQSTSKQVLLNKNLQKTIKFLPQVSSSQLITGMQNAKTVSLSQLNQFKAPTKILPAGSIATGKTTQRIVFKSAGDNQTILPQGQILQLAGSPSVNTGQLHQINIPGRGMQYIKFVTSTSEANSVTTTTTGSNIKTSTVAPTSIVLTEVKSISSLNRLVPKAPKDKLPISPSITTKSLPTTTPLMVIPAHIPATNPVTPIISKIAIPPITKPTPALKTPAVPMENAALLKSKEEVDANGMRPRKPCNCNKSQCLKLYCDCFANGEFCYMCNCLNCNNNLENEEHRNRAIKACLERNPYAFRPKIGKSRDMEGDSSIRKHTKGCNCKRSGCLKNYCECYEAKIACSNNCKCIGCRNVEDSIEKKNMRHLTEKATNTPNYSENIISNKIYAQMRPRRSSCTRKQPLNFITDEVIEATCQCLLTISDNADENMQDEEMTKRLIIEEFGRCLTEIIECSASPSARAS